MGMSNYLEVALLNHIFRAETYTPPNDIYLALYTAGPSDDGTGTEVAGGSYARQVCTYSSAVSPDGKISNDITLSFLNMPACTIVGTATCDSLTVGNVLTFDPLSVSRVVVAGENLSVVIGDHRIYLV